MDLLFHRIQRGGFASLHLAVPTALQLSLQVAQLPPRLAQVRIPVMWATHSGGSGPGEKSQPQG
jgi:hypothetical protein